MEVTRPTGIRAFGWGVLGFFGTNIIFNLIFTGGTSLAMSTGSVALIWLTLIVAFVAGGAFVGTRKYQATATGGGFAFALQTLGVIAGMVS